MKHQCVFSQSPHHFFVVAFLLACHPAFGQKTTNTSLNVSGTSVINIALSLSGTGQGTLNPFGAAALTLAGTLPADAAGNPTGPAQATLTFSFSRSDSFTVSVSFPDGPAVTVSSHRRRRGGVQRRHRLGDFHSR